MNNVNILFRDLYGMSLVLFIGLAVILASMQSQQASGDVKAPGSVVASISWPTGDTDVDLWVIGPGEPVAVGYSNKGGVLWNLLRDDLGLSPDYTPLNYENAFTRGMPPGEYRINVQCFRCPSVPIPVTLEITKKKEVGTDGSMDLVATSTITLNRDHEEKTGLAFTLDNNGNVVPGSMNTLFKPLRHGSKQ